MPSEPKRTRATNMEIQLLASAAEHSVRRGTFELTAGGSVDWYIAGREVLLDPQLAHTAGKAVSDLLSPEVEGIIGPATAGIIVVAAVQHQGRRLLPGAYWRSQPKEHGLARSIEGNLARKVAVVDDTCATGHSVLECAKAAEAAGSEIVQIISVFDRDQGGEKVRNAGYQYDCVMRLEDGKVVHRMLGAGE